MQCYENAQRAIVELPAARSEPVEAAGALATGLLSGVLTAAGLESMNDLVETLVPTYHQKVAGGSVVLCVEMPELANPLI